MKSAGYFALILGISVLFRPGAAFSTDVSGDVWGTWTLANSPYYVIGDVRVPPESTLTIEPGVEVYFYGYYKFIVDNLAVLYAVGTETDSILFDEGIQGNGWHGIRFLNASSQSQLSYCILRNGYAWGSGDDQNGGAIYCSNSSPTISNNAISGNSANTNGGAIYCSSSSPKISNNAMSGNSAFHGGAISCYYSSPTITSNTVSGNSADWCGGAIECESSSPTITSNTISGNSANSGDGGAIYCDNSSSPSITSNTIIGNSAFSGGAIYCDYSSSPSIISNTIIGNFGGAIFCDNSSSPSITSNTISGNSAYSYGGAVSCFSSSPAISNNTISGNSADDSGGAIYCSYSSPTITSNTIIGNSAIFAGGAIYCYDSSSPSITSNTITGNLAGVYGGAIYYESCQDDTLRDNVISANTAQNGDGGGIYFTYSTSVMVHNSLSGNSASGQGGAILCANTSVEIVNSILWGDSAPQDNEIALRSGSSANVSYSDVQGGWPGTGNIDADPLFVNPAADNLHLHWGSPCIDTGDPASPPDPDGTTADMGALYFDQSTSPTIEIYPQGEPITIPPGGGSVTFDGWIYNLSGTSGETLDVWTMANVPGIGWYGPIDLLTSIYVPPDGRIGRNNLAEYVVGGAPAGDYTYVGYIGTFPNVVVDSSYFTFTKESSVAMGSGGGDGLTVDRIFRGSPSNSLSLGPTPR